MSLLARVEIIAKGLPTERAYRPVRKRQPDAHVKIIRKLAGLPARVEMIRKLSGRPCARKGLWEALPTREQFNIFRNSRFGAQGVADYRST
jgi:hypothetical protein